jgi:hypothetical protein
MDDGPYFWDLIVGLPVWGVGAGRKKEVQTLLYWPSWKWEMDNLCNDLQRILSHPPHQKFGTILNRDTGCTGKYHWTYDFNKW